MEIENPRTGPNLREKMCVFLDTGENVNAKSRRKFIGFLDENVDLKCI